MVSPASPLALQPPTCPLPAPVRLAFPISPWAVAPCESCRSAPAAFTLTWPDVRFRTCSPCLPPVTPAGSVLGVVAIADQSRRWVATFSSRSVVTSGPARPWSAAAVAPGRVPVTAAVQPAGGQAPALPEPVEFAEREVLHSAARTVSTSPPSLRGRRLSPVGGCDVVAALMLAAGGAVDETGRPAEPTERPAAQLLRRALRRVADQLAGCAAGRSWTGDPVALIDSWQAHPGLTRSARAAVLNAAVGPIPGSPPSAAPANAPTQVAGEAGTVVHRRPVPTSTALLEDRTIGARS